MHAHHADVLGRLEPHVRPSLASIIAAIHAVAPAHGALAVVLAAAYPHRARVLRVERDTADRGCPLPVEDRRERGAGIRGLPHTAVRRGHIPHALVARMHRKIDHTARGERRTHSGNFVDTGFIPSMKKRLGSIVDPQTGPVTTRKKSYQDRISQMDRRIDQKEKTLSKREEQLRKQFAKMEEAMSRLQGQGAAAQASLVGGGR